MPSNTGHPLAGMTISAYSHAAILDSRIVEAVKKEMK